MSINMYRDRISLIESKTYRLHVMYQHVPQFQNILINQRLTDCIKMYQNSGYKSLRFLLKNNCCILSHLDYDEHIKTKTRKQVT